MRWFKRTTDKKIRSRDTPILNRPIGMPNTLDESVILSTLNLTPRENEILEYLVAGKTLQAIADVLGVKHTTVNSHCASIYKKVGVKNRAQLVHSYYNNKLRIRDKDNGHE